MLNLSPIRPQTRRVVLFYAFLGLSVVAMIGVAIWLMPHVPNVWGLRDLVGAGLFIVLACIWGVAAKFALSQDEARELSPKREKD